MPTGLNFNPKYIRNDIWFAGVGEDSDDEEEINNINQNENNDQIWTKKWIQMIYIGLYMISMNSTFQIQIINHPSKQKKKKKLKLKMKTIFRP